MKWIQLATVALVLAGCSKTHDPSMTLTLATTTSTRDSGLLDVLVPMFEKQTGIEVKVVAVGSGQALALGRRGDADVLLTHAPEAEQQFVAEGHGERRRPVMHNDFVLVGPETDPAHLKGQKSIAEAFRRIAGSASPFISRGDESGTHMKELRIWKEATIDPQGQWYVQAGAGMADALRMASEKRAYTLADRGTFLAHRARLDLTILSEGDPLLRNSYAVIVVSSEKHPGVNHRAARRFSEFLLSPKVQRVIGKFGIKSFGQPLFFPRPSTPRAPSRSGLSSATPDVQGKATETRKETPPQMDDCLRPLVVRLSRTCAHGAQRLQSKTLGKGRSSLKSPGSYLGLATTTKEENE